MRLVALIDDDSLGLIRENEILGLTEEQKNTMINLGYARVYDDTKPIIGKSVNIYQSGFSYPPERQVFTNNSIYISNCQTSTTWVASEWDVLVTGKNAI